MESTSRKTSRRTTVRDELTKTLRDVVGQEPGGGFAWTAEKLDSQDAFGGPGVLRILIAYMTLREMEVVHRWDRMHHSACRARVRRAGLRAMNTQAEVA